MASPQMTARPAPATGPEAITIGNYQLLQKLGEGGMGAVFKGVDLMVEREVAIKMLRPEIARQPEIVERFHAEAIALAKLNHPHIATLYSFFREGDQYFMVMEFVKGRTLEKVMRDAAIGMEQAVTITSQVLEAVEHAHSLGILHRDIKPANIMLTEQGQVKVTDFGIARLLGTARMTREGCLCGTLEYLAPERIRGVEADIRSDLYSMGVVLYEMLSGRLPFEGSNEFELMRSHLEKPAPAFASLGVHTVPEQLEAAVFKALSKTPEDRFPTASEFRLALAGAGRQQQAPATGFSPEPPTFPGPPPAMERRETAVEALPETTAAAPRSRLRWKTYAGIAAILLLIVLILAFSRSRTTSPVEATKPQPAPVAAPPPSPLPQPASGSVQDAQPQSPARPASVAGAAGATPAKAKPNSAAQRRKAALQALDGAGKKTDQGRDRRSSSLDALKQ